MQKQDDEYKKQLWLRYADKDKVVEKLSDDEIKKIYIEFLKMYGESNLKTMQLDNWDNSQEEIQLLI